MWDVHPRSGAPRQDAWRVGRPYRASIPALIAQRVPSIPSVKVALAEEAATAIAGFDREHGGTMAPYASMLLRSESASSSQIEQLSASARKVVEAEVNDSGTEHAMMIVGNVRAMTAALRLAGAIDIDAVLAMHEALMTERDRDIAGRLRLDQVWIGGKAVMSAGSPHDADFVPPTPQRVPELMRDLISFAGRDDMSAIVQAAIAHAQFETIHPFADGNGRTGRALLQAMLRSKDITRSVSVPLSGGLLRDTSAYFDALTAYREGAIEPIVEVVARAALIGVDHGRALVDDLRQVREGWDERLAGLRKDSGARRLAGELFRQPVVSAPIVRELLGIDRNEHRHIDVLVDRGLLKASTDFKARNRTWRADDVLGALDRYAQRVGRRVCG